LGLDGRVVFLVQDSFNFSQVHSRAREQHRSVAGSAGDCC
jgi:hypothetical protein